MFCLFLASNRAGFANTDERFAGSARFHEPGIISSARRGEKRILHTCTNNEPGFDLGGLGVRFSISFRDDFL